MPTTVFSFFKGFMDRELQIITGDISEMTAGSFFRWCETRQPGRYSDIEQDFLTDTQRSGTVTQQVFQKDEKNQYVYNYPLSGDVRSYRIYWHWLNNTIALEARNLVFRRFIKIEYGLDFNDVSAYWQRYKQKYNKTLKETREEIVDFLRKGWQENRDKKTGHSFVYIDHEDLIKSSVFDDEIANIKQ